MTELAAANVGVSKGGRAILSDVSLRACGGEFIAVIGPNGAGKSTLLSALAGLLRPSRGTILLDGRDLASFGAGDLARRRAYVPQSPRCEWPLSVERVVALGLTPVLPVFGGFSAAQNARIAQMLSDCDLMAQRHQAATTLSGGEFARAMLARALVGDPEILIVDEPMEGLDPRHRLDAADRLRALSRAGKLVVASVHDLTLAMRYATRVIALHRGHVAADGPPLETMTSDLLRRIFDVDARIAGADARVYVDYLASLAPRAAPDERTSP
jgi:iron complex transport system ATP-binding protein